MSEIATFNGLALGVYAAQVIAELRAALDEMGDNGETPLHWDGRVLVTYDIAKPEANPVGPVVWIYVDSSVPGAGYGEWATNYGGLLTQAENPLDLG